MNDDKRTRTEYISNKIKELRLKTGWSQSELARRAEVTSAAISQIEKGDRMPSLIVSRKISGALNISLEELLGESSHDTDGVEGDAQTFYLQYGDIKNLSKNDQDMIKNLIDRLKGQKNDTDKR